MMSPKRQRLWFVIFGMAFLAVAATLALRSFNDNLVFFYSPTELTERPELGERTIRVGGLVKEGSVEKDGQSVRFLVTDMGHDLRVRYTGLLPSLFREGQGVVAEGMMDADGAFAATQILAKHDENYMPPEVARAIKKSGHWKEPQK